MEGQLHVLWNSASLLFLEAILRIDIRPSSLPFGFSQDVFQGSRSILKLLSFLSLAGMRLALRRLAPAVTDSDVTGPAVLVFFLPFAGFRLAILG